MHPSRLAGIAQSGKRFAPVFVSPPAPPPTYGAGPVSASSGITNAMWTEWASQRASFGDPNDAKAMVDAIPTTGTVVSPGANLATALASSNVVIMSGGIYTHPGGNFIVPAGKKLIGAPGATVQLTATNAFAGIYLQNNTVLANIIVEGAQQQGIVLYHAPTDFGSTGVLVYQCSVRRTGLNYASGSTGAGIFVSQGAHHNVICTTEAFDTWNELGGTGPGGNADNYNNSTNAINNSFIDCHGYRAGDDGLDMWDGGPMFAYFSEFFNNGFPTGKGVTGDGNGVKLGRNVTGAVHKFYKTYANNNKSNGYDLNGNLFQPVLVLSTASGNGGQNYAGVTPP